jgi:hypothetical protein
VGGGEVRERREGKIFSSLSQELDFYRTISEVKHSHYKPSGVKRVMGV